MLPDFQRGFVWKDKNKQKSFDCINTNQNTNWKYSFVGEQRGPHINIKRLE